MMRVKLISSLCIFIHFGRFAARVKIPPLVVYEINYTELGVKCQEIFLSTLSDFTKLHKLYVRWCAREAGLSRSFNRPPCRLKRQQKTSMKSRAYRFTSAATYATMLASNRGGQRPWKCKSFSSSRSRLRSVFAAGLSSRTSSSYQPSARRDFGQNVAATVAMRGRKKDAKM